MFNGFSSSFCQFISTLMTTFFSLCHKCLYVYSQYFAKISQKVQLIHNHVQLEDMHDLPWNENINGFKLFLLFHYMNQRFINRNWIFIIATEKKYRISNMLTIDRNKEERSKKKFISCKLIKQTLENF